LNLVFGTTNRNFFKVLSITGSYASKGLETMFLEHKVVTNNQGLKIGDDAPKFVVVSNDLKEVTGHYTSCIFKN
jgi:hypothetical protein